MKEISVFSSADRRYERYLGEEGKPDGHAFIAKLIGDPISQTMGGGVVIYEKVTVDWDLPFDEMITLIQGSMKIHSGGKSHELSAGDVAWFPAHTPLTYEVPERVVVSYAIYPQRSKVQG
jgi:ethanolamine utilization protein EutQ